VSSTDPLSVPPLATSSAAPKLFAAYSKVQ
jgi:hypothetical protein